MKEIYANIIFGSVILFSSLLMLSSTPTSPMAPLTLSISIILIIYGIFMIKKYNNMKLFAASSSIISLLGIIWALYNTYMPINGEYTTPNDIIIALEALAIFLMIYSYTNRFKNSNTHLNQ